MAKIAESLQRFVRPIAELKVDPGNARRHGERNLAAIKSSLADFGQQKPVVCLPDGTVIAGNGVLVSAMELGWSELAAVQFTEDDVAAIRAFAVADNRTAELAEWSADALTEALSRLRQQGWDVEQQLFLAAEDLTELIGAEAAAAAGGALDDLKPDDGVAKVVVEFPLGSEGDVRQALADLGTSLAGLEWKEDVSI